jgi:SAM-dependent methyltransferase
MNALREFHREAIALALAESERLCAQNPFGNCAWYHVSWPILKGLGVFLSLKSDDDFLLPALHDAIAGGARRILISGTADAGVLARVATFRELAPDLEITVLDCCPLPLALCQQHADLSGYRIRTVQADILGFRDDQGFDLICTHSFMTFFNAQQRRQLVRQWFELLRPGGAVITAQRVRPDETELVIRFPPEEVEAMQDKAAHLARKHGNELAVPEALARHSAGLYGEHHRTHLIAKPEDLREPFDECGFLMEHFAPPPEDAPIQDVPGAPGNALAARWRLLARRP